MDAVSDIEFSTYILVAPATSARDLAGLGHFDPDTGEISLFDIDAERQQLSLSKRSHPSARSILAKAESAPASFKEPVATEVVMTSGAPILRALDAALERPDLSIMGIGEAEQTTLVFAQPRGVEELTRKWRAILLHGGGLARLGRSVDEAVDERGKLAEFAAKLASQITRAREKKLAVVLRVMLGP